MFRIGVACVWLLAASRIAIAESSVERGFYLVNTIMACGNCHTPRDADGKPVAAQALSGGLTAGMKQADLADIIACLRTVPPLQQG